MKLHDLRPDQGSRKKRKRVGRGISAGQGKTAGRGTKGQNARSGGRKVYYNPVNLRDLEELEAGTEVGPELYVASGVVHRLEDPVVILGEGNVTVALNVKAHRFSASAQEKIIAAGGTVEILPLA